MIQLDRKFKSSNDKLEKIRKLCEALTPTQKTIKCLFVDNAGLLLAEKAVVYNMKKLSKEGTEMSKISLEKLEVSVQERRNNKLIFSIQYLKSCDYLDKIQDKFGNKIRPKIAALATKLVRPVQTATNCLHTTNHIN